MITEQIEKIWFDKSEKICVQPQKASFDMIYRSAMGIRWNALEHYLYPYANGSWSYIQWFRQIISAVRSEYGCQLTMTAETHWENIDEALKLQLQLVMQNEEAI